MPCPKDIPTALDEVSAAAAAREQAQRRFVAALHQAYDLGASYRQIAAAANLSHQRIAQILTQAPKR